MSTARACVDCGDPVGKGRKGDYCARCEGDRRQSNKELLARLNDGELVLAEAKRVIATMVRDEMEEFVRRIAREELSMLLKKMRERMGKNARVKTDGGAIQHSEPDLGGAALETEPVVGEEEAEVSLTDKIGAAMVAAGAAPVTLPLPPIGLVSERRPPRDDKPKADCRCLCCGALYERWQGKAGKSAYCHDCYRPVHNQRERAIVRALWERFPEIGAEIVEGLKAEGRWAE